MRSDRRVNQSFDNKNPRLTRAQQEARTIGRLRRAASNAAWTASWRIQQGWGWIGFGVLVLATLTGLGFAGYVLFHLISPGAP